MLAHFKKNCKLLLVPGPSLMAIACCVLYCIVVLKGFQDPTKNQTPFSSAFYILQYEENLGENILKYLEYVMR